MRALAIWRHDPCSFVALEASFAEEDKLVPLNLSINKVKGNDALYLVVR